MSIDPEKLLDLDKKRQGPAGVTLSWPTVMKIVEGLRERDAERDRADALAAHVERLESPSTVFIENVDEVVEMLISTGPAENILALSRDLSGAAERMVEALDDQPTASLARRDARMKSEALEGLIAVCKKCPPGRLAGDVLRVAEQMSRAQREYLRRQAEGDNHE